MILSARQYVAVLSLASVLGCKENVNQPIPEQKEDRVLVTKEVVFFSSDRAGDAKNIFMMTTDGQILKQITAYTSGEFAATAISPDSTRLLFYQSAPGLGIDVGMDIYIYRIREDTIVGPITQGHPGNFTPNGRAFVFSKHMYTPDGGYESVYQYDLTDHSETRLTTEGSSCFFPQMSPDGGMICYETARYWSRDSMSSWQLRLMDNQGHHAADLTTMGNGYYAGNGVFTPDGRSIVFHYNEQTWCYDICRLDIASGQIENLTRTRYSGRYDLSSNYYNPSISNDGRTIYFYSRFIDYQYSHPIDIYRINSDGTGKRNLTEDAYWDSHPIVGTVSFYIER